MKQVNLPFALLLEHLEGCGGCLGDRQLQKCKHAGACAVAEVLQKKGFVKNRQDLLTYGVEENDKPRIYCN